jgi:ABC-type nitrate/sulfonate/bicarbonate transport system substrate-binding protein
MSFSAKSIAALAGLLISVAAAHALDTVRIALPIAVDLSFAPVFVADQLGYFRDAGIAAEITPYRGAGAAQEALAAGAADVVNIVPSGAALAIARGVPELIIAPGPQVSPSGWHMLALAKGPIQQVQQLDGKKVAVSSKNSTTDMYALWAADHYHVKFETVPLGPADLAALKGGQVDAIVRSSAQALRLLASGDFRSLVDYQAVMGPNLPECWVATKALIAAKPAVVHGFLQAMGRASQKLRDDESYSLSFLRKYLDDDNAAYLKLSYDTVIKGLTVDQRVDLGALENSIKMASLAGLTNLPAARSLVADFALAQSAK